MARPLLAMPTWGDAATITASAELATAPASNLQLMQPKDIWDSNGLSGVFLEIDRGSIQPLSLVSVLFTNLTAAAVWRVRIDDTQAAVQGGAAAIDSGTVTAWASSGLDDWPRRHTLFRFTSASHRWIRIDLSDGANPDSTIRAGRLYVSDEWRSSIHMQQGAQLGLSEQTTQRVGADRATTFTSVLDRALYQDYVLGWLSEDEMLNNMFEIQRLRGSSQDVLSILDPDATTHLHKFMCYGLLELRSITKPRLNKYQASIRVQELR